MRRSPLLLFLLMGLSFAMYQSLTGNGFTEDRKPTAGALEGKVRPILGGDSVCVELGGNGGWRPSACGRPEAVPVEQAVETEVRPAGEFGGHGYGPTLTADEVADLWVQHGGDPAEGRLAAAVAMAESGRSPTAVNESNDNGSVDRGLFQMNTIHDGRRPLLPGPPCSTFDLHRNVECAVHLRKTGGWGHWVAYDSGAYRKHL